MTCFIHRLSISAEKPIGHRNNFAIDQLPCFDLLAPTAIPNLHLGKRFLPTFLLSFPPPSIDRRTILLTGHSPCTQKLILSSVALPVSDPNENAVVTMFDDKDAITRKFKRAVTDSDTEIRFDREKKPGVSNLLSIYCGFTGVTEKAAEEEFAGKGYGELKARVAESVIAALEPIQREQKRLAADKAYLEAVLKTGAEKAERIANRTLEKVYRKVGFIPRAR